MRVFGGREPRQVLRGHSSAARNCQARKPALRRGGLNGPAHKDESAKRDGLVVLYENSPFDGIGSAALCDTITVVRARHRQLAKLVRPDGPIEDYDSARRFNLSEVPVAGLGGLTSSLRDLANRRDCCIVRGAIADPSRTLNVRRLVHPDKKTGDAPTLVEVPRRWLALDIDRVSRPANIAPSDLSGCAAAARDALPAPFRNASHIAQATASHGIKPGLRLRLWFWLDRPTTGVELKSWLRCAPVDNSVFGAAQIIYTALPVFAGGAADPLPQRLIVVAGKPYVRVPPAASLMHPKREPAVRASSFGAYAPINPGASSRYSAAALNRATARVARAHEGDRHSTLLTEARGLTLLVGRRVLTERAVAVALTGAAELAGLPSEEAADLIAWALAHPRAVSS